MYILIVHKNRFIIVKIIKVAFTYILSNKVGLNALVRVA